MKITFSKIPGNNVKNPINFGEFYYFISDNKFVLNVKEGNKQFFFEGEIYYAIKNEKIFYVDKNEYAEFLKSRLNNFNVEKFINEVEGIYNCVFLDTEKNEAVIFCDYLNRKNFFYTESETNLTVSTNLQSIVSELKEIKYDSLGLYSYITMGYTPVYQTLYEGIKRFDTNEYVKISNGEISHNKFEEKFEIENYNDADLDRYNFLLNNAVKSRALKENYVLNSGGWDSTSIIYHLLQSYESSNINSVVYESKLKSGEIYNIFETDKVKRISDYYGVKSEKILIDFNDKTLINDFGKIKEDLKNYHTYFFVDMPKAVYDISKKNSNAAIFSGEASDSIHNFGFSQFVSVTYNNYTVREYGDKMKSYLFGPSFFEKIKNGSFKEDSAYKFFRYYFFENTGGEGNIEEYLKSFMLSGERIPFANSVKSSFAKNSLLQEFNLNLSQKIFHSISEDINKKNIYYYLLLIYRAYHFHSPQIEVKHSPIRKNNFNCKIPFLDSSLVKYMYSMPESWGRGLEMRPTKYPLRKLAHSKWDIPVDILEEKGPHSYIGESNKKWNYSGGKWSIYAETIYNSVFEDCYKEILSSVNIEKYFNEEYFNTSMIKNVINDFVEGKQDLENAGLIYKLGVLFFIGLYE